MQILRAAELKRTFKRSEPMLNEVAALGLSHSPVELEQLTPMVPAHRSIAPMLPPAWNVAQPPRP